MWPDEQLEAEMLRDCRFNHGCSEAAIKQNRVRRRLLAGHIRALLQRVRTLEAALKEHGLVRCINPLGNYWRCRICNGQTVTPTETKAAIRHKPGCIFFVEGGSDAQQK